MRAEGGMKRNRMYDGTLSFADVLCCGRGKGW